MLNSMKLLLVLVASTVPALAEIPVPDDAPLPRSPADSQKCFALPEGFRIDLIAAEPLVEDPSGIAWGKGGELFVTEIHGYNVEGQLDVDELNKTGELDTSIRRLHVGPALKAKARKRQHGSLKLLRDTDGDGRMDEAIVWADDLPPAYGVVAARDGVIVTAAPDILYFADTDGDGRPDVREILFTGFAVGELERGINNPVWGVDGWLYAGRGWGGGNITGPRMEGEFTMPHSDFRFRPDGSVIEVVSGSNHTFGMAFDDVGNRFLSTTSTPAMYAAPLPYHYLKRNPHVASPQLTIHASNYGNTFPISKPHPWRSKRAADPRWIKFYGAAEATANGHFTSACGQEVYRASLFPQVFHGNYFCCEPQQNLVHRAIISRDGPGLRVRRPEQAGESEFLSSSDGWFRPTNLRVGPDGALYIVDMYREIIEDYSAIPRHLQQQYGLLKGTGHGRIWRLAPETSAPALIVNNSINYRDPVVGIIEKIYRDDRVDLASMLVNEHYAVRMHALRMADQRFGDDPRLIEAALELIESERDPSVLLQLALSLGESEDSRVVAALAMLAADHGGVRWMDSAVLSSLRGKAGVFVTAALKDHPAIAASLLERAAVTAARDGDVDALLGAAVHADESLRLRLIALAAEHGSGDRGKLRVAADRALGSVHRPDRERLAALALLPYASPEVAKAALEQILHPAELPAFQAEAVVIAVSVAGADGIAHVIEKLGAATPRLKAIVIEALLSRPAATQQLLARESAQVEFSEIQWHRLLHHDLPEIRQLAEARNAKRAAAKSAFVLDSPAYVAALGGKINPDRGAKLFATHCSVCHQFGGKGFAVGPGLDAEAGQPAESLLRSILQPSAEITAGYGTYLAKTNDGTSHVGVLASDSATSLTLADPGGARIEILRSELASLELLELSLMPAVFGTVMKPDEIADLIAFIQDNGGGRGGRLVLFEDDPAFPSALADGDGRATLDWSDASSGRACVTIEGFQRHARQLPGWNFAIREKPSEGEFRFLRIAMRSRGAKGMMLELADDQAFPSENQAVRTYFVGENSTGWVSNELAKVAPKDWQNFTIDLWEGNGDFTFTGVALTTMGGKGSYDHIELFRESPQDPAK